MGVEVRAKTPDPEFLRAWGSPGANVAGIYCRVWVITEMAILETGR